MNQDELLALIARVEIGEASDEDLSRYNAWCNSFQEDAQPVADFDRISARMLAEINRQIEPKRSYKLLYRTAAAAAVLLLLGTGVWYWRQESPAKSVAKAQQITPGTEKATLILGDGSEISLEDAEDGQLANRAGAKVVKLKGNQLAYQQENNRPASIEYNTLQTPRGGKYRITLPDGTRVWLNAATMLRFPTRFEGKERLVQLSGEAYFEVAANTQQPFKVATGDMQVQVLGTSFNIMSYSDEPAIRSTLLDGAVKLVNAGDEVVLKPGQQGVYNGTSPAFRIAQVNTAAVVAWKDGQFIFENEDIKTIMRRVARWYDAEIEFAPGLEDKHFGATISQQGYKAGIESA
ncbi:FecR domain-containing protein [Chitinophaga sedimenti]|uniref:FecR family protein n=1 Tax=Chitinophaga sedimenti TaxID=2033606 RepID=UPI00200319E8|nr:FecR domain-containing protein [Chitinophaga sedimenti]MCK7553998.1 FecR domain-containing protein [Chitinophaga sedimenti]